jgi:transcriptional regulator with AAA-type ATPase domain/tetratricopeptide (TPR) repeat protein
MRQLLADRFVLLGRSWIDVSSGAPVRLRFAPLGGRSSFAEWETRCAEVSRLRHPLINNLLDFGLLGRDQTFEAYAANGPVPLTTAAESLLLTHAVRFLESSGIVLTSGMAAFVLRSSAPARRSPRGRALGVRLQPRPALEAISEALDDLSTSGMTALVVCGRPGVGLRTVRAMAARLARVAGYVPLSSSVAARLPGIADYALARHVCILAEETADDQERGSLAPFVAQLAMRSTRRHILIRFARSSAGAADAVEVQAMSRTALSSMVVVDRDLGPAPDEIEQAVRASDGLPGRVLERLGGVRFADHIVRIAMVHESAPAYHVAPAPPRKVEHKGALGRLLADAPGRGARLAEHGRHAAAIRLLSRASRVLEGRGDAGRAAACAYALAWVERSRGRSDRALAAFERTRMLAGDGRLSLLAAIGTAVGWTDDDRLTEAEAALRGLLTAAAVTEAPDVSHAAARALARVLTRQSRHDDAVEVLRPLVRDLPADVESWGLLSRAQAALGDCRAAVAAASSALAAAERVGPGRLRLISCRAMAAAQLSLGDRTRAGEWLQRALRAASSAHLPITGLRIRAQLLGVAPELSLPMRVRAAERLRARATRWGLPQAIRSEVIAACDAATRPATAPDDDRGHQALKDLQRFLHATQIASDDRAALEGLCASVIERLRSATVQVVAGGDAPRIVARVGRPWQGDTSVAERVLCGGGGTRAGLELDSRQVIEPIRFGSEVLGAFCCRWTAGVGVDLARAGLVLRSAALAAAGPLRGILDCAPATVAHDAGSELIGSSPAALALREAVARAARAPFPVLVEGESGSGKELVARAIHRLGSRRERRLCTLNCAAIADELVEAELFGHARGAFTGAVGERAGLFEEADGGTLFLDEVGELSARAQAKLLRVLQDGEVRRVGENMPRRVDARIVAATNRGLEDEARAGRFRSDLRFRLDVVRIHVPPLRDRVTDIPLLAAHFWADAAARVGSLSTLTAETTSALARYDWPGNVRELQNAMALLAVHAPRRGRVPPSMLPAHIARAAAAATGSTFEAARTDFERRYVRAALAQAGGHRMRAARALGMSRQGLAKMLRRLRIDADGCA